MEGNCRADPCLDAFPHTRGAARLCAMRPSILCWDLHVRRHLTFRTRVFRETSQNSHSLFFSPFVQTAHPQLFTCDLTLGLYLIMEY